MGDPLDGSSLDLEPAASLLEAMAHGYLLGAFPRYHVIFFIWSRWCDAEGIPDLSVRIDGEHAHIRLDMAPCQRPLSEQALQQAIVLLFGDACLEIHRRLLADRAQHGLSEEAVARYYACLGPDYPVRFLEAKRVPVSRARAVAQQLVKLARDEPSAEATVH